MRLEKANDIVDQITPIITTTRQHQITIRSKTGSVFCVKEKQSYDLLNSDVTIQSDTLTYDEFIRHNDLERFLIYERFIFKAAQIGCNRTSDELALDRVVSKDYYLHHKQDKAVVLDGLNVKCGNITLDHHFKNTKRVRRLVFDKIMHHNNVVNRYDLAKPGRAIYLRIIKHIMEVGPISYRSVWNILGWADYKLVISRAIKSLRNYIMANGNINDHLTIHDYSNFAQPVAETMAHLLGFGYVSHFNYQPRLAFSKSESTVHLNLALLANQEDIRLFLESNVMEAVVITFRKKEFMDAAIATGRYLVSGIDLRGVQNYVYVKLKSLN